MLKKLILICLFVAGSAHAEDNVILETNLGTIQLQMLSAKAPVSVANFLAYVDSGFYDGTIFHRVIKNYIVQGGGFDQNFKKKPTQASIINEAQYGYRNLRGTVAMARTNAPDSATSQFFINVKNNPNLDYQNPVQAGYSVFAKVQSGMDIVDKISYGASKLTDVPVQTIIINRAYRQPPASASNQRSNHD